MTNEQFMRMFKYDSEKVGYVGVEREAFVTNTQGVIVPRAHEVLTMVNRPIVSPLIGSGDTIEVPSDWYGYELSACQVESRIGPVKLENVRSELSLRTQHLKQYGFEPCDLMASYAEVAPADMPLDVYPDPTGRYERITKNMPKNVLLAACRVAGTHVHIGMRDHESALRVYNYVIQHVDELCELGNGSFGERLAIYRQMAPNYKPRPYKNWDEYYAYALWHGFAEDPRKCWTLIRISVHGTLEFRMFGATECIDRIVSWVERCHELCLMALTEA